MSMLIIAKHIEQAQSNVVNVHVASELCQAFLLSPTARDALGAHAHVQMTRIYRGKHNNKPSLLRGAPQPTTCNI